MLEIIKQIQWVDIREYDREMIERNQFCPACGAAKVIGHHTWCTIKKVLDEVEDATRIPD